MEKPVTADGPTSKRMLKLAEESVFGLINRVVPQDKVLDEAMALAEQISEKSAAVIAIGKTAFYRQVEEPLGEAYDTAAEAMAANMMIGDAEEGLAAFIGKRKPSWSDS